MFRFARLTLTIWYLAIIMIVSISFSAVIYKSVMVELDRFARVQRYRIERRLQVYEEIAPELREHLPPPSNVDLIFIDETRRRFVVYLVFINAGIAAITGVLGYFLAGKTLQPIQDMVDEQTRFIGDASHELRTPLTSLITTMEVALRDKNMTSDDAKIIMKENLHDVHRLQLLSEQLLQLTQFEKPSTSISMKAVPVSAVVQQALHTVQPLAAAKSIQIHTSMEEVSIHGNKDALSHLLIILLDNAIKYGNKKGEIHIKVNSERKYVHINVTDNGIGIAEKDVPHIFDRFYRADEARTKNGVGGYGLGLSIAQKIVQTHHGMITIKSQKSKGTTVSVRFQIT